MLCRLLQGETGEMCKLKITHCMCVFLCVCVCVCVRACVRVRVCGGVYIYTCILRAASAVLNEEDQDEEDSEGKDTSSTQTLAPLETVHLLHIAFSRLS